MKKLEFYIAFIAVIIFLVWSVYTLNFTSKIELKETIKKVDSLEVKVKILEELTKQDTIIINLNLKQNGN